MTQTAPHVLLVDSVTDEREMYSLALSKEGFVPVQASDSAWAFDYATVTPPALIVTDAVLEPDDGLTFARRLRRTAATREIPIIVLSGRVVNLDKSTTEAHEAGADLLLLKPCAPTDLVARARTLIARSSHLVERADAAIAKATRLCEKAADRLRKVEEEFKRLD